MKKLKLREKLSKSNLTIKKRYHYEVISNKEILNKIKPIVAYNIKNIDNDNISFNCNKKTLIEILKLEKDVKVTNLYRNFLYNKIFKKAFFWVGLFIILIIFLLNQIFLPCFNYTIYRLTNFIKNFVKIPCIPRIFNIKWC